MSDDWIYELAQFVEQPKGENISNHIYHYFHEPGAWNHKKNCMIHALKLNIEDNIIFVQQVDGAGLKKGYPLHYDTYIIRKTKKYLDRHMPIINEQVLNKTEEQDETESFIFTKSE